MHIVCVGISADVRGSSATRCFVACCVSVIDINSRWGEDQELHPRSDFCSSLGMFCVSKSVGQTLPPICRTKTYDTWCLMVLFLTFETLVFSGRKGKCLNSECLDFRLY